MTEQMPGRRPFVVAFFAYLGFVVYGSLVPFVYRAHTLDQALEKFRNIPFLDLGVVSRADWVANILLYIPLALLACFAMLGTRAGVLSRALVAVPVYLFCMLVAFGVEFAQIFVEPRTVSQNDLIAEGIGSAIGVGLFVFLGSQLVWLWRGLAHGGRRSITAMALVYLIAFVLLSMFPFDFVLSPEEFRWRLASDNQGWLLAGSCGGSMRCIAGLIADALVVVPLGVLFGILRPRMTWQRAFLIGTVAGLVLELSQLLLASSVSQGLTALMRGQGLIIGVLLGQYWVREGSGHLAYRLWPLVPIGLLPYLLIVQAVNGWMSGDYASLAGVRENLSEMIWLPFYHHYFTTETNAMASLLAQGLVYAPVGIALWLRQAARLGRGGQGWLVALLAAGLSLIMEFGKLFLEGLHHPDLTNPLIAASSALLTYWALRWLAGLVDGIDVREMPSGAAPAYSLREPVPSPLAPAVAAPSGALDGGSAPVGPAVVLALASHTGEQTAFSAPAANVDNPELGREGRVSPRSDPAQDQVPAASESVEQWSRISLKRRFPMTTPMGLSAGAVAALIALVSVLFYPAPALVLPVVALVLLLYGAALWFRPWLWVPVAPAVAVLGDFSTWTGVSAIDALDLMMLTTLGVVLARYSGVRVKRWRSGYIPLVILLLWASWGIATVLGLAGASSILDSVIDGAPAMLDPWLVGKGLFWALLTIPMWRRTRSVYGGRTVLALLSYGLIGTLAILSLVVIWERHVFVGLFDFGNVFRVTGTFASMRTGGAYIEAFIALAFPLLLVWLIDQRRTRWRVLGALMVILSSYAMVVTFSRAGYGALVVGAGLVAGVFLLRRSNEKVKPLLALAGALVLAVAVALPVVLGAFAQDRLGRSQQDLITRLDHWGHALGLLGEDIFSPVLGFGFGQYTLQYILFAEEDRIPGTFAMHQELGDTSLRLSAGRSVYLDQSVDAQPSQTYRLNARARAVGPESASFTVSLCRKELLYSQNCRGTELKVPSGKATETQSQAPVEAGRELIAELDQLLAEQRDDEEVLGEWVELSADIEYSGSDGRSWVPTGPMKLSIGNGRGVVDITQISLVDAKHRQLLANGKFDKGSRYWLFVTDQDLAWHIHEQYIEVLFAQGLLGLGALFALIGIAAIRLKDGIERGDDAALGLAAGLMAFLAVGLLGSTLDAARSSFLFYCCAFAAVVLVRSAEPLRRRTASSSEGTDGAAS